MNIISHPHFSKNYVSFHISYMQMTTTLKMNLRQSFQSLFFPQFFKSWFSLKSCEVWLLQLGGKLSWDKMIKWPGASCQPPGTCRGKPLQQWLALVGSELYSKGLGEIFSEEVERELPTPLWPYLRPYLGISMEEDLLRLPKPRYKGGLLKKQLGAYTKQFAGSLTPSAS